MALKIRSISKMVANTGLKILVHGPAGAGKTVLCCTAGVPTLILSAEGGLLSVENAPDYIKGVDVSSLEDLDDVLEFLIEDAGEDARFKWVALDSITEIAEALLSKQKETATDPRQAYGFMADEIMKRMRKYRDLCNIGYNVIMSCKQERNDDDGKKIYGPMMPGTKVGQQIPYLFDLVFALRVELDEDKNPYRVLQTSRDARYEAKDRSGTLEMFEKPNLKKIYEKVKLKNKKKIKEMQKESEEKAEEETKKQTAVEQIVPEDEEEDEDE